MELVNYETMSERQLIRQLLWHTDRKEFMETDPDCNYNPFYINHCTQIYLIELQLVTRYKIERIDHNEISK